MAGTDGSIAALSAENGGLHRLLAGAPTGRAADETTLRTFYDHAPVLMGIVEPLDDGAEILHVDDNAASCRFFGREPGGTAGRRASELGATPATIRGWTVRYAESRREQRPVRFEHDFGAPDGRRWLSVTVAWLGAGTTGPDRFCYVAEEITGLKQAQQAAALDRARLAAALDHQRLLFRELSHRVVNGFQMMASLLLSQRRGLADEAARRALELAAERVRAMALVHRRLYGGETGLGTQQAACYLRSLCDDLREAFITGITRQTLTLEADELAIPTDMAVTIGMMVAELVTNAAKHAHGPDQPGRIEVRFERLPQRRCRLSVGDDGAGLPVGFDPERSRGLGMTVAHLQARQLGGELRIDGTPPGVRFVATFPEPPAKPPSRLHLPICTASVTWFFR